MDAVPLRMLLVAVMVIFALFQPKYFLTFSSPNPKLSLFSNLGKHCCPQGLKCDVEQGRCIKNIETPLASIIIDDDAEKSNICPDPAVKCAPSQTCCQLADGSFGCCPFKDAVCCKDGQHCCPSGLSLKSFSFSV